MPDALDGPAQLRRRLLLGLGLAALPTAAASANACASDRPMSPVPVPEQAPVVEGRVQAGDVRLWYWDTGGSGPPVILFHPISGSGHVWLYQQPALAAAGYRVIGYSRRGFRGSDRGPAGNIGVGSTDLLPLLDHLGIQRFHAVASAGGAFVATDFALSHPGRLLSLTLACTMLGVTSGAIERMNRSLITPGFFEIVPPIIRELGPSYRAIDPEGTERWQALEHAASDGAPRLLQPTANVITLDALKGLITPTLVVSGEADLISPPPLMRLFAEALPDSVFASLPECGHAAHWEQPGLFNELMLQFLERHRHA